MAKQLLLNFIALSLSTNFLMAMDPNRLVAIELGQRPPTNPSLLGSAIVPPGAHPSHINSPLLQSTLRHLKDDGSIKNLSKPVVIDDNATAAILEGGALMHIILNSPPVKAMEPLPEPFPQEINNNQPTHLTKIISIMWYLYSEAINKGEAFTDGSFIFIDNDSKLFTFLMHYARKQNHELTGTHADPLAHSSTNPFAYSRDSSHWKNAQKRWAQYGIDIRFAADRASEPLLPTGKKHLLFGIVADGPAPRLFIKFEDDGLYSGTTLVDKVCNGWELLRHGWGYVLSRVPKQEKNMPPWWYDTFLKPVFGSDEGPDARREHTSVAFTRRCSELLQHNPALLKKYCTILEAQGVSKLGELLEDETQSDDWDEQTRKAFADYYHELCGTLDHTTIRKGCEVILGNHELFSSLYFYCVYKNLGTEATQAYMLYEILKRKRAVTKQLGHLNETIDRQPKPLTPEFIQEAQAKGKRLIEAQELLQEQATKAMTLPEQAPQ